MRVGPRIVLAIAVVALAGAISVLLVLPAASHVEARYQSVLARTLAVRAATDHIDEVLPRLASARLAYLATARSSDRDLLVSNQRQWDLTLADLRNRLSDRPTELTLLDQIEFGAEQFDRTTGATLLDAVAPGRVNVDAAAEERIVTEIETFTEREHVIVEALRRADAAHSRAEGATILENTNRWRARIALGAVTVLALALFAALYLMFGVLSPLVELARFAEAIARGERPTTQWNRRDELGEVARAISTMSQTLDKRERDLEERSALVSLDARLGAALNAAPDVRGMCERSLVLLSDALGAFAAAMFVREGWTKKFVREASFGAVRDDGTMGEFQEGEGALGRVAETHRAMAVRPGPDGAPRFETGTASLRASEYRIHPVMIGQKVIAVVEIALTDQLDDALVAHLDVLLDQLGIALSTAMVARERDKLLERLEHQYDELREREETLRTQSEKLDQQARELSRKNDELQTASTTKSQFIATMSHELRTPLNSILGFTELLLQRSKSIAGDDRKTLEEVRGAGRHLLSLINDILDLARIGAGKMLLRRTAVPVVSIAREVTEVLRPQAAARKIALSVVGDDTLAVDADPSRLRQILLNLVGNAVKFTDVGSVTIDAKRTDEVVRIEIIDTGPGISATDKQKLFREFSQIDSSGRRHEGSGLGLAIARELVIAHGGEIGVESQEGAGSTFWFTLPARALERESRPPAEPAVPAPVRAPQASPPPAARIEAPAPQPTTTMATTASDEAATKSNGAATRDTPRILLVEDHPRNARLIESMLAEEHVGIDHVTDGLAAVDRATTSPPDLVLLDLELPGIDGFEVARRLRSHSATAHVPIVAVTARALPADEARARAIGCDEFITKPIDIERLRTVVREALSRRAGERAATADA